MKYAKLHVINYSGIIYLYFTVLILFIILLYCNNIIVICIHVYNYMPFVYDSNNINKLINICSYVGTSLRRTCAF